MPQYRYRAVAPDGSPLEETIEAASAHQATLHLQERGYTVNTIEPLHAEFAGKRAGQLSWQDLELFARQLLSITERNLPLAPALRAFTVEMAPSSLKGVLDQIRIDLERGATIEEAIRSRGGALPPLFAAAARAGEASGAGLPSVLRILVQHSTRMIKLQNSLHTALAYPILVVAIASGVALLLLWRVLPVYLDMSYAADAVAGSAISVPQHALHTLVEHPTVVSATVVGGALAIVLFTRYLTRGHADSLAADRIKLRIPRFGRVYYQITVARFSRTLAALLAARVPIVEALELAAAASGSPMLQQAVGNASPRVALGNTLSHALDSTGYFGPGYCWLLGTAEARNAAEEALENLSESAEREAAANDQLNLQLIGPLALMMAGAFVLYLAMSFMIPIHNLIN